MHHDQDIRNMGGLRKYMPVTWITSLVGSLALIGTPLFSGFYSKDSIIEAVHESHLWGSGFAYFAVVAGVFVTAFYSFRMYFLVFHGSERFRNKPFPGDDEHDDEQHDGHGGVHAHEPHESPWVVTLPLVLLAIPSVIAGAWFVDPLLFDGFFNDAIAVLPEHPAMAELAQHWHSWVAYGLHGFVTLPFWLVVAGFAVAWYCYLVDPRVPAAIHKRFSGINRILDNKYYADWINEQIVARAARGLGHGFWKAGDRGLIDGIVVNGSARMVGAVAALSRHLQSGYIYHYAFAMIIGIMALLTFFVLMVY